MHRDVHAVCEKDSSQTREGRLVGTVRHIRRSPELPYRSVPTSKTIKSNYCRDIYIMQNDKKGKVKKSPQKALKFFLGYT